MADLYKYGVAVHLYKPIVKRAVVDFAVSADWTPAAGDVKISKDGGAAANVTNLPVAIVMGNTAMWDYSITATEMQAAKVRITVADSATKAVEDQFFEVDTYGNASAQHAVDLTNANLAANVTQWLGSAPPAPNTAGVPTVDTREVARQGTAQAGASGSITLDAGASATDNFYVPCRVRIVAGTGAGQGPRVGTGYVGSTKVLTVLPAWTTNPSTDSIFQLTGVAVDVETWLKTAPNALTSGKVQASADLVTWLGSAPSVLVGAGSDAIKVLVSAVSNNAITAASIATDAIDADAISADGLAEIVAAVRAMVIETNNSVTLQQAMSVVYAVLAGITSSGGGTIKDPTGTATRAVATVDGSNDRTAMTITPSA